MIWRITVGDDRTPTSDQAWHWVTAQTWPDCRVDVVRSAAAADGPSVDAPARTAPSRCGFTSVRTIDTPLAPQAALEAHAGTDLLVVGAQAWSGGQPAGLGRTVEGLVRHADVPVVVGRAGGPAHNVLACLHESPSAEAVVSVLLALPFLERAVVTVLTVSCADAAATVGSHARPQQAVDALTRAGVRAHLRVAPPDDVIATSGAGFRILEVARRLRPDLMVLGAPGGSLAARLRSLRRSVALEVARDAECSVLLARGRGRREE